MAGSNTLASLDEVWRWIGEVPDPEIPVISVVELGIVRDVAWEDDTLVVTVTPTYSGCPATALINEEITAALKRRGVDKVRMERRISPAWTTDWMAPEARERLRGFGIVPPVDGTASSGELVTVIGRAKAPALELACPRCGSTHTERVSQFGSTPCKASWRCKDCLEPFDYFKCI